MDEFLSDSAAVPMANALVFGSGAPGVVHGVQQEDVAGESGDGFDDIEDDGEGVGKFDPTAGIAYLAPKPAEEAWDCESVVSTYSNLDNHPEVRFKVIS